MRKLRQAMVKFRADIDFETRAVSLTGLQLKARHAERSLNAEQFLVGRTLDIETPAPDRIDLGGKRRKQCRKKLVAHRNPFRARDIFLIKGSRGALAQTEKSATATKPVACKKDNPSSESDQQTRAQQSNPRFGTVQCRDSQSRHPFQRQSCLCSLEIVERRTSSGWRPARRSCARTALRNPTP